MLTQKRVNALVPDGTRGDYIEWDLPGFGVRLRKTKSEKHPDRTIRTYVIVYRDRSTGAQRRIHLGRVERVPLSLARAEAKKLLAQAALGKDPAKVRTASRRGLSVADLAEKWLSSLRTEGKRDTTLGLYRHNLSKSILPKLGNRPARAITAQDVRALYFAIRDANPTKANRTIATLSSMLGWASRRDILPSNPAAGAVARQDRAKEQASTRFLNKDEVSRFLAACHTIRDEGGDHARVVTGFQLMLLCGLRPSDVFPKNGDGLRWSEIDLDSGLIHFENQKAGDAPAFLSGPARALLASLDRKDGDIHVFPSSRKPGLALADVRTTWKRICELAEFDDPRPAPKCLRKTFATMARAWGWPIETIGTLLRHAPQGVTEVHYAQPSMDPTADAGEAIANGLAGLGGTPAPVIQLKTVK